MAIPQQKFREAVFQLLYSHDMSQADEKDMLPLIMAELAITKKAVRDAQQRMQLILEKTADIDALISKISVSYAFERIQTIERNILRLAIFELLYDKEIPPKVAIAEAVRLTRKFGTPESANFVNAILDSVYKASQGEKVDNADVEKAADNLIDSENRTTKLNTESQRIYPQMNTDGEHR